MTLNVIALDRGGFSAQGGAWFDARDRIIRLEVVDDEVIDVVIQFTNTPTDYDYIEDGIDGSEPAISGNTIAVQFQEISANGVYELLASFASGAVRRVKFQANEAQPFVSMVDADDNEADEDDDPGAWG